MKELALIALLGGGDLICGEAYLGQNQISFEDVYCEITTIDYGICHVEGGASPPVMPKIVRIELIERGGELTIYFNEKPVGTCD